MDPLIRLIQLLLRVIYLLLGVLLIYSGSVFYLTYYPPAELSFDNSEAIAWQPRSLDHDLPEGAEAVLIKEGADLILRTSEYIGPLSKDPGRRLAGNNLSCGNCHLDGGRKIASGSFVGVANRFPQFRGRENKIGTLEERVNGCMQRSMNGEVLAEDSREMKAIIAYMEWLSEGVPEDMQKLYKGYKPVNLPEVKADTSIGHLLYIEKCMVCHGDKGQGQRIPGDTFTGYVYPPLGGEDTYNDGAGMNRVITAAEFIKSNMPFGATYDEPLVSDEEAYHLAAYINTFNRPEKHNKELDFPDKTLKPVSTPYGPWTDDFSAEEHKFGPFQPIMTYYQDRYGLRKTK